VLTIGACYGLELFDWRRRGPIPGNGAAMARPDFAQAGMLVVAIDHRGDRHAPQPLPAHRAGADAELQRDEPSVRRAIRFNHDRHDGGADHRFFVNAASGARGVVFYGKTGVTVAGGQEG